MLIVGYKGGSAPDKSAGIRVRRSWLAGGDSSNVAKLFFFLCNREHQYSYPHSGRILRKERGEGGSNEGKVCVCERESVGVCVVVCVCVRVLSLCIRKGLMTMRQR